MESSFFENNRRRLMEEIGPGAPVVLAANGLMQMSRDTEYPFEQDRNFLYLTGVDEPNWALVIENEEEYLIAPWLSEVEEVFNGIADLKKVAKVSGVKKILTGEESVKKIEKLNEYKHIRTIKTVLDVRYGKLFTNHGPAFFLYSLDQDQKTKIEDITDTLLELRTIKQPAEIEEIKKAINFTNEAFKLADKQLKDVKSEAELESIFTGNFISKRTRHAYNPIVASGANACTLHYTANKDTLKGKGLVLMDIGARSNYYAADVTRTRILPGVSKRQLEVKEAVEKASGQILGEIKPGIRFEDYQKIVDKIMLEALKSLNLDNLGKYFPHAPSHGLGLDVHDPIVGYETLEPGMVITLEPGIYIPEEGIGVRHEDDLLITSDGVENLSRIIKD